MARILFIEQYYYPDGWGGCELPRDITCDLQAAGHRLTVLCGSDQYIPVSGDPGPDPASAGIRILRVPKLPGADPRRGKLLRQMFFYVAAFVSILVRPRPDLFVAQTNPPLMIPIVALLARVSGRPLLIIAQDLYPEAMTAAGMLRENSLAERLLGRVFGSAYRSARRVISLGPSMTRRLEGKGVDPQRIVLISNWATGPAQIVPGASNRLRSQWELDGRTVVLYTGNLGKGHEFETLLSGLAAAVSRDSRLLLLIIGQGSRLEEVRSDVARHGLADHVQFRPPVPSALLPEAMGLASIAVLTLQPGFHGLIVPSKLLGYMARGLPVLYVGPPADSSDLIERAGCGRHVLNGDVAGVADVLSDVLADSSAWARMGARGQGYYRQHLSREQALLAYRLVVAGCLGPGTGAQG